MSRPRPYLLLATLLAACSHPEAFGSGDPPDPGPFAGPPPQRITFNVGRDLSPAFAPDGSALLYGYQTARPDLDQCIGRLAPGGGSRLAERCYAHDPLGDSTDVLSWPAQSPSGRLAWVEQHGGAGLRTPFAGSIRIGSFSAQDTGRVVRTLPYPAPSGAVHGTATHLAWLTDNQLVYVGAEAIPTRACQNCKLDTLVLGHEIVTLDVSTAPATLAIVPGTTGATAVWPIATGSAIAYTLVGDSLVYRRQLGSGVVDTLHDFGSIGIARDPAVVGNLLTAIVGGRIAYSVDPQFGPVQYDSGGTLYQVDLGGAGVVPVSPGNQLLRHAARDPLRPVVVAEATDTGGPFIQDLYLYPLP